MNPDPTIGISLDYLVELNDDGKQPGHPEPEVIIIPPAPQDTNSSRAPANMPEQVPPPAEPKRRRKKR